MKKLLGFAAIAATVSATLAAQDTRPSQTLRVPSKSPVVAEAAMNNDVAAVRALIARGENVNIPQGDGMTALHWAAERGNPAMLKALLAARASVKATTRIGDYTPLHVASRQGNAENIKALLAAGSDARAVTTSGATALHFAAAAGSEGGVQALVAKGAQVDAREKIWDQTPLMFAATDGRADAIRELLKAGANPSLRSAAQNLQEAAAVEQAAARKRNAVLVSWEPERQREREDSIKRAQAAMPAGALIPPVAQGGGGGGGGQQQRGPQPIGPFTPAQLQAAIDSGRTVFNTSGANKGPVTEEVDTINGGIPGFANTVGGVGGLSPLHHAVRQGHYDAVKALLDGGAPINELTGADKTTPLLMATINGQFDVAMLLIKYGANPNLASIQGNTPLYATVNSEWRMRTRFPQPQAVEFQKTTYMEVMEALLKAGANPNARISTHLWYFAYNNCGSGNCGLENTEGTTAFWRAAYSVDVDAMRLLKKYGADHTIPSQRNPANAQQGGRGGGGGGGGGGGAGGAAALAALAGRGGVAPPQPALDPAIDSAARAVPPGVGVYPVHAAAGVGYGNGFAGNSHRHKPEGWMPAMKYLVEELGADVNARDANGYTPLHHAAARGDNEMIMYLVSKGADVKAVSRRGQTTVDMANGPVQRLSPIPETIKLLESLGAKNSNRCVSC